MDQNIIKQIQTKSEAKELLFGINLILESFNFKKKSFEAVLEKSLSLKVSEIIKTFISEKDKKDVQESLITLKNKLQALKAITLTLAFSPTGDSIKKISSWIKENLGEEFIFEIEEDPTIIGGAIIVYKGKYKNLSLKKKLEETFKKNKEELLSS